MDGTHVRQAFGYGVGGRDSFAGTCALILRLRREYLRFLCTPLASVQETRAFLCRGGLGGIDRPVGGRGGVDCPVSGLAKISLEVFGAVPVEEMTE